MHKRQHANRRGLIRAAVHVTAALLIGAVVIVWSWNVLATDLFAAPAMGFKHAIAAEVLLIMAIILPLLSARTILGRRRSQAQI